MNKAAVVVMTVLGLNICALAGEGSTQINEYFREGWKKFTNEFVADIQNPIKIQRSKNEELTLAELGQKIYFDQNLSSPAGQSCASCHAPSAAFSDPNHARTSPGAVLGRTGGRNAPTAMYSAFSPAFHTEKDEGKESYIGGQFFDGRAGTLEDQAKGPFLNPKEMNNTKEGVVQGVLSSAYAEDFKALFGSQSGADIDATYNNISMAIAAFERSKAMNSFSSKYDLYLNSGKKAGILTEQELRGLKVFNDSKKGNCAACHPSDLEKASDGDVDERHVLFTDFSYDNLGVPAVADTQGKVPAEKDMGLFATTKRPQDLGKFKVPTLRNIALTAPYMHNGYFKTLRSVIEFYATRDAKDRPLCKENLSDEAALQKKCWPRAEVPQNVNREELGNLKLTEQDKRDLEAFLLTLTDGYIQ